MYGADLHTAESSTVEIHRELVGIIDSTSAYYAPLAKLVPKYIRMYAQYIANIIVVQGRPEQDLSDSPVKSSPVKSSPVKSSPVKLTCDVVKKNLSLRLRMMIGPTTLFGSRNLAGRSTADICRWPLYVYVFRWQMGVAIRFLVILVSASDIVFCAETKSPIPGFELKGNNRSMLLVSINVYVACTNRDDTGILRQRRQLVRGH